MSWRLLKPYSTHFCVSSLKFSRVVACVSPSLKFSSIAASSIYVLASIYVELESDLRIQFSALIILRCNTTHILSSQCKHILDLVILIFVSADLPANSPHGHGSRGFTCQILSLSEWGEMCPSWSERCCRLQAGLRARPHFNTAKNFPPSRRFQCWTELFLLLVLCVRSPHLTRGGPLEFVVGLPSRTWRNAGRKLCCAAKHQNIKWILRPLLWRRQCGVISGGRRTCSFWNGVSNVVEVRHARYFDDGHDTGLPSTRRSHFSPGKGKKRRSSASPILNKNVSSCASAHISFEAAHENSFAESSARRSGRDWWNASVYQRDTNNNLIVYMFKFFSHL